MEVVSVGPFVLGRTLGTGATGKVKLGFHRESGFKVAIKIISKNALQSRPQVMQKLEREIAIMKFLDHPNVLRLFDVYDTPNYLFLVLEHVEGGELFDYLLSRGKLPEEEARVFFQQLVDGISYCHAHLICHRDLKPENILLDANHQVKICDFGMAALMPKDSLLATSCGSPHYASPEVITGRKYDGMEADVWSLGVILFALLVGKLPFDDPNIRKLLLKVKIGVFDMPAWLDRTAKDLIWRMLTVDPEKRATIAEIKQHPWVLSNGVELGKYSVDDDPTLARDVDAAHLDTEVVQTLTALWGNEQSVMTDLLAQEPNVTKVFYRLVERRFKQRAEQEAEERRKAEQEREEREMEQRAKELAETSGSVNEERGSAFRIMARKSLSFFRPASPSLSPAAPPASAVATAADDAAPRGSSPPAEGQPKAERSMSGRLVLSRRASTPSGMSATPPASPLRKTSAQPAATTPSGSRGSSRSPPAEEANTPPRDLPLSSSSGGSILSPERKGSRVFRRLSTPINAAVVDPRLFTTSPVQTAVSSLSPEAARAVEAGSPINIAGASPRKSWFNFFVRGSKSSSSRGYEQPPLARSFVSSLHPDELWARAAPILDELEVSYRYSKSVRCLKVFYQAVDASQSVKFFVRMTHVLTPRDNSNVSYLHWEYRAGSVETFLLLFQNFSSRAEGVIPRTADDPLMAPAEGDSNTESGELTFHMSRNSGSSGSIKPIRPVPTLPGDKPDLGTGGGGSSSPSPRTPRDEIE